MRLTHERKPSGSQQCRTVVGRGFLLSGLNCLSEPSFKNTPFFYFYATTRVTKLASHDVAIVKEVCLLVDTAAWVRRRASLEVCAEKARLPVMGTHSSVEQISWARSAFSYLI